MTLPSLIMTHVLQTIEFTVLSLIIKRLRSIWLRFLLKKSHDFHGLWTIINNNFNDISLLYCESWYRIISTYVDFIVNYLSRRCYLSNQGDASLFTSNRTFVVPWWRLQSASFFWHGLFSNQKHFIHKKLNNFFKLLLSAVCDKFIKCLRQLFFKERRWALFFESIKKS